MYLPGLSDNLDQSGSRGIPGLPRACCPPKPKWRILVSLKFNQMRKFLMKSNTFLLLIYIIVIYTNFVISMIIAYQVRIGVLHSYKKSY